MSWHQVTIRSSDVADLSATALIEILGKIYREAYVPGEFLVYHSTPTSGGHIYWLSPKASELSKDAITEFQVRVLTGSPNVSGLEALCL